MYYIVAVLRPEGKHEITVSDARGIVLERRQVSSDAVDSELVSLHETYNAAPGQLQTDTVRSVPVPVSDVSRAGRPNHPKTPRPRRT